MVESEDTYVQVVHSGGITRVQHAPKSAGIDRLFTCGDDFLVRLLPTSQSTESEPKLLEDATGCVTWLDSNSTHLVTSSEDGVARLYSHSSVEMVSILTRSSLPLRCISIEPAPKPNKSARVAIVSDELIIKVIDISDVRNVQILGGHSKPVRTVSWSPIKPILVSTSCDGSVKVWDLSESESKLLGEVDGILKNNYRPENEFSTNAVWHPSGNHFVLPSKSNEIVSISSNSWSKSSTFNVKPDEKDRIESPNGEISFMSFSPNGRYLASSTSDSQVTIWETSTKKPIKSKKSDSLVTGISWNPIRDDLAWTDDSGQLTRWENVVGKDRPSSFETVNHSASNLESNKTMIRDEVDDLFDGTGLDDDEMESAAAFADVEAGEGNEGNAREKVTSRREKRAGGTFDDEDDLDDFIEDDDNGENQHLKSNLPTKFSTARDRSSSRAPARFASTYSTKSQPIFQPGSTQSISTPSRRFLSFNEFGTLVSVEAEGHHVVQFESFDVSARRNFRINDYSGYTMGSLGATGALLACPSGSIDSSKIFGEESSNGNSSIFFKPFEAAGWSGGQSDEWSITLPKGEDAIALALGGNQLNRDGEENSISNNSLISSKGISALIATSSGYLRTFSPSGLQRNVIALDEPIVTITAGKFTAMIVTRKNGGALDGYQNLSYTILDLTTSRIKSKGSIPLVKDSTLTWAGFSELDTPSVFDSNGTLYVLNGSGIASSWMPILETRKLSTVNSNLIYWPVSISKDKLHCLILRGSKFPDASSQSKPLIQELDFILPICSRGDSNNLTDPEDEELGGKPKPLSGVGLYEETYLRESLLSDIFKGSVTSKDSISLESNQRDSEESGAKSDKALLQIIQAACKSDKHSRALEATSLLNETRMLDGAIKIANFFQLVTLAERMQEFREGIESKEKERKRSEKKKLNLLLSFQAEEDEERNDDDIWMTRSNFKSSRVLAPPSQESTASHLNGFSTNEDKYSRMRRVEASRALGESFVKNSNKRSLGMGLSNNNLLKEMPPPTPTSMNKKFSGIEWPESSNLTYESPSDNEDQDANGMDLDRQEESESRKRKSTILDDEDEDRSKKPGKKSSNPFAQTKANPFARTSSNQSSNGERKRSLHKSQSFFERVDAADKEKSSTKKKQNQSEKISSNLAGNNPSKQSKLTFGKKNNDDSNKQVKGKGKEVDGEEDHQENGETGLGFERPNTSSAFVESQDLLSEESQDRIGNEDLEISLTLQKANEKDEESRRKGQVLEETQVEEDDSQWDETQPQDEIGKLPEISKLDAFKRSGNVAIATGL